MGSDVVLCLVCHRPPRLLDTLVESQTPEKVVRLRLVECRSCGTVRRYRTVSTTKDMGEDPKRYLRGPFVSGSYPLKRVP